MSASYPSATGADPSQQIVLDVLARLGDRLERIDGKVDKVDARVQDIEVRMASKEDVRATFADHEVRLREVATALTKSEADRLSLIKKDEDQEQRLRALEQFKERAYGVIIIVGLFSTFIGAGIVKLMHLGAGP